ncbi:ATP-binding protein [Agrobacterium sp. S2]|nr:ATP-binding protein [Agrobacterium sp. S2]
MAGFIEGLRGFEGLTPFDKDRLVRRLRDPMTIDASIERYHDALRALAAEVREFELWVRASQETATRSSLEKTTLSLRDASRNLNFALTSVVGRATEANDYQAVLASEREVLITPPDLERLSPGAREFIPPLADLYVEPSFRLVRGASAEDIADERWWMEKPARTDLSEFLLSTIVADPVSYLAPVLVLGHPGAGKSSLMRMVEANVTGTNLLPVRVELRDVNPSAGVQEQIEESIASKLGGSVRWADFRRSTSAVPIVMLDGLDELLQAGRESMADYLERVRAFQIGQRSLGGAIVFVTRPNACVEYGLGSPRRASS